MTNSAGEPVVLFYLSIESGFAESRKHSTAIVERVQPNGERTQTSEVVVTIEHDTSIEQPACILIFGTSAECNIVLDTDGVAPVHCKVFAQLNSGPDMFLIEDVSGLGTLYHDDESFNKKAPKVVKKDREVAVGLHALGIGPHIFRCQPAENKTEIATRDNWFRTHEPILVTDDVLGKQLGNTKADYHSTYIVGKGGNGEVFRNVEKKTGLVIAIKIQIVKGRTRAELSHHEKAIQKEIRFLETLKHPFLVEHIMSYPIPAPTLEGTKWLSLMPMYQGCLNDILPLSDPNCVNGAIMQTMKALMYMHEQRVLHRDVKPQNILINQMSPLVVALSDYGLATSLNERDSLYTSCGTAGFAAPEVLWSLKQTTAMDVYSLGVTIFVLVEPDRFTGMNVTEFCAAVKRVFHRPPKSHAKLIQAMMASDFNKRPSLQECWNALNDEHCSELGRDLLPASENSNLPVQQQNRDHVDAHSQNGSQVIRPSEPRKPNNLPADGSPKLATVLKKATGRAPAVATLLTKKQPTVTTKQSPVIMAPRLPAANHHTNIAAKPTLKSAAYQPPRKRTGFDFNKPPPSGEKSFASLAERNRRRMTVDQGIRNGRQHLAAKMKASIQGKDAKVGESRAVKAVRRQLRNESSAVHHSSSRGLHSRNSIPTQNGASRSEVIRNPSLTNRREASTNKARRMIKRSPHRRAMVYQYAKIEQKKAKFYNGIVKTYREVRKTARDLVGVRAGLLRMAVAACEMPYEYFKLIFHDCANAYRALQIVALDAGLGLNAEGRMMYGIHSRTLRPLRPSEYEEERMRSRQRIDTQRQHNREAFLADLSESRRMH